MRLRGTRAAIAPRMTLETIDPERLATAVGGLVPQWLVELRNRERFKELLKIEQLARYGGGLGHP